MPPSRRNRPASNAVTRISPTVLESPFRLDLLTRLRRRMDCDWTVGCRRTTTQRRVFDAVIMQLSATESQGQKAEGMVIRRCYLPVRVTQRHSAMNPPGVPACALHPDGGRHYVHITPLGARASCPQRRPLVRSRRSLRQAPDELLANLSFFSKKNLTLKN